MSAKKLAHGTRSFVDDDGGVGLLEDSEPVASHRTSPQQQQQQPQLPQSQPAPQTPLRTPGTPTSASHFVNGSMHKSTGWALRVENWPSDGTPMDIERVFGFLEHPLSLNIVNDPSSVSGDRTLYLSFQTEAGYQKAKDLHGMTLLSQVVPDYVSKTAGPSKRKSPRVESAYGSPSLASTSTHSHEPLLYISHPLPSGFLEATRSLTAPPPECPLPTLRTLSVVPDQDAAPPPKSRRKRVGPGSSANLGVLTGSSDPSVAAANAASQPGIVALTPSQFISLSDTFTRFRQIIDAGEVFLRRLRILINQRSNDLDTTTIRVAQRNALIVELNAQQNLENQIKAARVRLAGKMSAASSALHQNPTHNASTLTQQPSMSRRTSPTPLSAASSSISTTLLPPSHSSLAVSDDVEMDLGSPDSSPSIPGLTLLPKAPRVADVIMRQSPARQFSQVGVGTPESSARSIIDQEVQTEDDLELLSLEAEKEDLSSRLKKILPERREAEEKIQLLMRELAELKADLEQAAVFRRKVTERCEALEKEVDPVPLERLRKKYQALEEMYEAEKVGAAESKKKYERRKAAWGDEEDVLNKRIRKALDYGDEERALKIRALDDLDEERHRSDKLLKAEEAKLEELEKQVKSQRMEREKIENDLRIDLKILGVRLDDEVRRREGVASTLAEKESTWKGRLQEYERSIGEMKSTFEESGRLLEGQRTESKTAKAERADLQESFERIKAEKDRDAIRLSSLIEEGKQKLATATEEKEALTVELVTSMSRTRAIQEQATQLEQQVAELTTELMRSRAENGAYEERLKRLEMALKDEESRRARVLDDLAKVEEQRRAEWAQSHEERTKAEGQAQELRASIHRLQLELQTHEQAIAQARAQAQAATASAASATASQAQTSSELPTLMNQWREEVETNAGLRRQIQGLAETLQERQTASDELGRNLVDARRELVQANDAMLMHRQREEAARIEGAKLEVRLAEVEREMTLTRKSLEQKIEDERVTGSMVLKLTARLIGASYGFRPSPDDAYAMSDVEE